MADQQGNACRYGPRMGFADLEHLDRSRAERIAQIVSLIDLTDLSNDHSASGIDDLVARAAAHHTAAVCVWPEFVAQCAEHLQGTGVSVATVVNFPAGDADAGDVGRAVASSLAAGADDIDVVLPYRAMLDGDLARVGDVLSAAAAGVSSADGAHLKVILETGVLVEPAIIRAASELAIACGAHFIKTSTGKTDVGATLDAVDVMLQAIIEQGGHVGIKPSGGIRTVADAEAYLELIERHLGNTWVSPHTVRFGASGLLADALSAAAAIETD